jgi:excisionase family DNA binding protein
MLEMETLTTGQAAGYCHVSQATIVNWIKKGKLKAYATPGGAMARTQRCWQRFFRRMGDLT